MMLTIRFTLQIKPFDSTATDSRGNSIDAWKSPVDWGVFGYGSGANVAPDDPMRESLQHVLWTVFAPLTDLPGERDKVTLEGEDYALEGRPRKWGASPFGSTIGQGVVYLKAVTG